MVKHINSSLENVRDSIIALSIAKVPSYNILYSNVVATDTESEELHRLVRFTSIRVMELENTLL